MSDNKQLKPRQSSKKSRSKLLPYINENAAGIDIGSNEHYVAVPEGRDENTVRSFKSVTSDLYALADWLSHCGIDTVAMESTGVYWIPLYELLEERGFEVLLVNARHVKNVSGRKTDVLDCQWLQQLHTFGLLAGAFRPNDSICQLRAYHRQREMLIKQISMHIQHMQKALSQMNVQLHNVISDITGMTGMAIIRAIIAGERNTKKLAEFRDGRRKNSEELIEKSLEGHYREEHVFSLKQAVELVDYYQMKVRDCDQEIDRVLSTFSDKVDLSSVDIPQKKRERSGNLNSPSFDLHAHLFRITGVNLTAIPGINSHTAFKIISEIGLDMNRWKTDKHFASWLGLCPGNKVSGGKQLSGKSKPTSNRAAAALRLAATSLGRSQTSLGAFYRRQKARLGAPKAITATAHKLARLFYNMLSYGAEYIEQGEAYYEEKYKERIIKNLQRRANALGFQLIHAN
jgi:transposase